MLVKTSELSGAALDWAVAKCETTARGVHVGYLEIETFKMNHEAFYFCYSTDWSQGGGIIERENISIIHRDNAWMNLAWSARIYEANTEETGKTPLIAAMRCYVASKLGDTVDIPEEL